MSLHEPVIVACTLLNTGERPQRVDLGAGGVGELRVTIELPGGRRLHRLQLHSSGFAADGEVALGPGASTTQSLLLQRWHAFAVAGRHAIQVELAVGPQHLAAEPVALAVLAHDATRLAAVCAALLAQARQPGDPQRAAWAAAALAHVADPLATGPLAELVADGQKHVAQAVAGLGRSDDEQARDLLRRWARGRDRVLARLARRALRGAAADEIED